MIDFAQALWQARAPEQRAVLSGAALFALFALFALLCEHVRTSANSANSAARADTDTATAKAPDALLPSVRGAVRRAGVKKGS